MSSACAAAGDFVSTCTSKILRLECVAQQATSISDAGAGFWIGLVEAAEAV
jgi:hypothetical protein